MMAQITPVPKMAPVRVARITSPEPMYSAHHTKAGPTSVKIARPLGGTLSVSFIRAYLLSSTIAPVFYGFKQSAGTFPCSSISIFSAARLCSSIIEASENQA